MNEREALLRAICDTPTTIRRDWYSLTGSRKMATKRERSSSA